MVLVSSFRYELRDDRRRAEMQTASQVESLKRDILLLVGSVSSSSTTAGPSAAVALPTSSFAGDSPAVGAGFRSMSSGGGLPSSSRHVRPAYSRHSSAERDVGLAAGSPTTAGIPPSAVLRGGGCAHCGASNPVSLSPCGGGGGGAAASIGPGAVPFPSPIVLNAVKQEIAASLRADIRELAREMASALAAGNPVDHAMMFQQQGPMQQQQQQQLLGSPAELAASELYQTHLYTQL